MNKLTVGSLRLFRFRGISVYLHWSWLLVAYFEIFHVMAAYQSRLWNVAEYLSLFAIVLMHEFGHALACRQVGGKADQILLWPLGGAAYVSPPQRPGAYLWSIAAGPLVNLALVPITLGMLFAFGIPSVIPTAGLSDPEHFLCSIALINIVLLLFNLLPIYPLDGGQIVRALLWFIVGAAPSLMVASVLGLIGGIGLAGLALLVHSTWGTVLAVFIGWRSIAGFTAGLKMARLQKLGDALKQAAALADNGEPQQAIEVCSSILEATPQGHALRSIACHIRGAAHKALCDYARAKTDFEESLRADPNSLMAMNNLAWLLATCPQDWVRDGATALRLATQACEISHWQKPNCLGTLGAALAETGRFPEAVKMQMRALQSPEYQKRHGDKARERLLLYGEGRGYREETPKPRGPRMAPAPA